MEKMHCFSHGTVISNLSSTNKFEAIHELLTRAPVFQEVDNLEYLKHAVIKRERTESTGIGHGVAVAHGKSPSVNGIVIALGISKSGIPFDSIDGLPVRFLFILANPPGMQLEYLLALSVLVRVMRDECFREKLLCCSDSICIETMLNKAFAASMLKRGLPL